MDDDAVQKLGPEQEPTKRAQAAEKARKEAQKQVKEHKALKALYKKISKDEAFIDLLSKTRTFADYHLKLGKDGRGFVEKQLPGGKVTQEAVTLSAQERIGHLDKASGIEEILNYVDRMVG